MAVCVSVSLSLCVSVCVWFLAADPWTWVPATWTGPVPAPRYGHSASVIGGRVFIFGGTTKSSFLNDLFVLEVDEEQNTAMVVTPKVRSSPLWRPLGASSFARLC